MAYYGGATEDQQDAEEELWIVLKILDELISGENTSEVMNPRDQPARDRDELASRCFVTGWLRTCFTFSFYLFPRNPRR